jgi:hypothetical protein
MRPQALSALTAIAMLIAASAGAAAAPGNPFASQPGEGGGHVFGQDILSKDGSVIMARKGGGGKRAGRHAGRGGRSARGHRSSYRRSSVRHSRVGSYRRSYHRKAYHRRHVVHHRKRHRTRVFVHRRPVVIYRRGSTCHRHYYRSRYTWRIRIVSHCHRYGWRWHVHGRWRYLSR